VINKKYLDTVKDVTKYIVSLKKKRKKKKIFCIISGSQGSGKTTFVSEIKKSLQKRKLSVLALSIDNFYLSKKERLALSKKISHLFLTRGVPGTHNLKLINQILKNFHSNKKYKFKLPLFSKGHDDILMSKFMNISFPYDIFLLEGWCVGYQGSSNVKIKEPVNHMEKFLDKDFKWRKYANMMSKKYFLQVYKKSDFSIFLKIPSFKQVFSWRRQQERKLPRKLRMNDYQLKKFISFYQRITLDLLKDYKKCFDSYISIDSKHNFGKLKILK
tara:strand:+ start:1659 stop:2474 length:816 start_codon:yes stop_codon:yes gene_type:complete